MALLRLNLERSSSEDISGLLLHCLSAGELTNLPALSYLHVIPREGFVSITALQLAKGWLTYLILSGL